MNASKESGNLDSSIEGRVFARNQEAAGLRLKG